jgi:hypothetical protein
MVMRTMKRLGLGVAAAACLLAVSGGCSTEADETENAEGASSDNSELKEIYTAKANMAIEHLVIREDGKQESGDVRRTLFFALEPNGAGDANIMELHRSGPKQVADVPGGLFEMAIYGADSADNSAKGRTVYVIPDKGGLRHTVDKKEAPATGPVADLTADLEETPGAPLKSVAASTNGVFVARDDGKILQLKADGKFEVALDTRTGKLSSSPRNLQVIESQDHKSATLYWIDRNANRDDPDGDTIIASVSLARNTDGPFLIPAEAKPAVLAKVQHAVALATDGRELFFSAWGYGEGGDEGYVGKMDPTGKSRKLVEGVRRPSSLAADDKGVYFTTGKGPDDDNTYGGGAVMIIDKKDYGRAEGEAPVRCFAGTVGTAPTKITLSGTNVFWVENAAKDAKGTHTGIFVWDKDIARKNAKACEAREAARDGR